MSEVTTFIYSNFDSFAEFYTFVKYIDIINFKYFTYGLIDLKF